MDAPTFCPNVPAVVKREANVANSGVPTFPQDRTCPYQPADAYLPLTAQEPLSRVQLYDGRTVWLVTGHDAARRLLSHPEVSADRQHPDFPSPGARFEALRHIPTPLLGVDGPAHARQRRPLVPAFTARSAAALRPHIQQITDTLLDAIEEQGPPADLVSAFAAPLSSKVACQLLGVPAGDRDFFESRLHLLFTGTPDQALTARSELMDHLDALLTSKETRHGEGLLDVLLEHARTDGGLDRFTLVRMAVILLTAGHETTANMITIGTYTLLQHPNCVNQLRAGAESLPAVIEELLRLVCVFDIVMRVATADITIEGHAIRAGDGIVVSLSLASHDPAHYPAPHIIDTKQASPRHLAFGTGPHQCLGQHLARTELHIAFRSLLTRFPNLHLDPATATAGFQPGTVLQRMTALPVHW
ncbi:cytochrome P450 [Streptomyces sp. NPDC048665]|uniref:cytochrome P450 n=1 Tax=Streptomyces sp. NPDC048665 TaxID=3155490 RepID=UPI003443D277